MVYMATRTQIYLTDEQRARLRERARATGVPMSRLIRDAIGRRVVGRSKIDSYMKIKVR